MRSNEQYRYGEDGYDSSPEFVAVWGNGNLGTEAGEIGRYTYRGAAEEAVRLFLERNDNPAVGAWVR